MLYSRIGGKKTKKLNPSLEHLRGYQKIKNFCGEAMRAGFGYAWADTCCIDKSSSAELSEAINSMFAWYRSAGVCYAYLADVTSDAADDFAQSSWFTRGWTLQELLAPSQVVFFGHGWTPLGNKQDLVTTIEKITGVSADALRQFNSGDYCIAHKMTWSAKRQTTRQEDRTYCLLRLFDINMPLLYGESDKAFLRFQEVQEELMKASLDSTLFYWEGRASDTFGMLAHDPSCFTGVGEPRELDPSYEFRRGWTLSNAGLVLPNATVHPYFITEDGSKIFVLFMGFPFSKASKTKVWFSIYLLRDDRDPQLSTYRRVSVDGTITGKSIWSYDVPVKSPAHDVRISRLPLCEYALTGKREIHFNILVEHSSEIVVHKRPVVQKEDWNMIHNVMTISDWPVLTKLTNDLGNSTFLDLTLLLAPNRCVGLLCFLRLDCEEGRPITIYLGLDHDFDPFGIVVPFADVLDFDD